MSSIALRVLLLAYVASVVAAAKPSKLKQAHLKNAEDEPSSGNCRNKLGIILQSAIRQADLPTERPPAWDYCGLRCAKSKSLHNLANGAMVVQVVHKPIPGITPEMVTWWFNGNVDGYMTHPLDGRNYSRYLVWHPRDHIAQRTVGRGIAANNATRALWSIEEFFQSRRPRGYLQSDNPCKWSHEFFTNVRLRVMKLDLGGLALAFDTPGPGQKPMKLTHEWSASRDGLLLTSTMHVGFSGSGKGAVVGAANEIAKRAFGGKAPEVAARLWQEHCLEEMSNLQYFLPQLYAEAGPGAAAAGKRDAAPRVS